MSDPKPDKAEDCETSEGTEKLEVPENDANERDNVTQEAIDNLRILLKNAMIEKGTKHEKSELEKKVQQHVIRQLKDETDDASTSEPGTSTAVRFPTPEPSHQ